MKKADDPQEWIYPDDIIYPTQEQLAEAISIAEIFREEFVKRISEITNP